MNNFIQSTSFILFCFLSLVSKRGFTQVETTTYNGKAVFIYPYQQALNIQMRNFRMGVTQEEIILRDSMNQKVLSSYVQGVKRYIKMSSDKEFKKIKKLFLVLRNQHPATYYNFDLPLEEDIVPALEILPDGQYIQYYRDLPYVDDNNVLRYKNDVISAVFILKNNQLAGKAFWLSAMGDTLKKGNFVNGVKEGLWHQYGYSYNTYNEKNPLVVENFINGKYQDTTFIQANFRNGLLNGSYTNQYNDFLTEKGNYKNGKAVGEWVEYQRKTKIVSTSSPTSTNKNEIETNESIVYKRYQIPEKPVKGKSIIVRNTIIDLGNVNLEKFNIPDFFYEDQLEHFGILYNLYSVPTEEGLELQEEEFNSFPGEEISEYEGDYYGDGNRMTSVDQVDFSYGPDEQEYYFNNKSYTRQQLIDSVGYSFLFDGICEEYYSNGQLKMRVEIKDGNLVNEPTIYWDNGKPLSVVSFNKTSNEYSVTAYDYDGQIMYVNVYDDKGRFVKTIGKIEDDNSFKINQKIYTSTLYDNFFNYENQDTLDYPLSTPVLISESLWKIDTTTAISNTYDPVNRIYSSNMYSLDKKPVYAINAQFDEEFKSVNALELFTAGKLSSKTQINGSYSDTQLYFYGEKTENDSIPQQRVKNWQNAYEIQSDNVLTYNDRPFSGHFSLTSHTKGFSLKSSESSISVNYGFNESNQVFSAYLKYGRRKKSKGLTSYITEPVMYNRDLSGEVTRYLFPFLYPVFIAVDQNHFLNAASRNSYEYDAQTKAKYLSEKQSESFDKQVDGQLLNGKPEGKWITKDQYGKVNLELNFINGELDGKANYYATAYPAPKVEIVDPYNRNPIPDNPLFRDSLPTIPVRYLSRTNSYKNGQLNGEYLVFNWMGDTLVKQFFKDGLLEGESIECNKLAYTLSNYENGQVDGITQTYLTLPKQDTVLLYDLNFQNGVLQGESKSYHLNGNLAKHGFFLNGQPIDDFEAFDSLGFKYQYVKFQFNQPIEEKIWEENQLSLRYTFDWRDSIYFNTADIAGSSSLDGLLFQLGLVGDEYNQPYYGRPSLVNKTGINYHLTKYYPNDSIARDGDIESGKKAGCWQFWDYNGKKLCEVDYFDSLIVVNDTLKFKSKGVLTYVDSMGIELSKNYIIEKIEQYDCAHTDHHEVRMLYCFWEKDATQQRINGYAKNYYDNGSIQNEGYVKNGLATGVWKMYDPFGKLNLVGEYKQGKRHGRWLSGDLSNVNYLGDICLNPNIPNLEEIMKYQEKLIDISVIYYQMGSVRKREYYGINQNPESPNEYNVEEMYEMGIER